MNHFKVGDYKIDQSSVGSGCCGEVFKAKKRGESANFAIKRYHSIAIDRPLLLVLNRRYQQMPAHPSIAPLVEYQVESAPYYSISNWVDGQPLDRSSPFSEEDAWQIIESLASALEHAHRYGVVHGNLHPGNIFLQRRSGDEEAGFTGIQVVDFASGLLGDIHHVELDEHAYYAAPEQLISGGARYDEGRAEQWDVYRFGMIAYWLLHQRSKRGDSYREQRRDAITNSGGRPVPIDASALAESITDSEPLLWDRKFTQDTKLRGKCEIMDLCLDIDPAKRPVDMREVGYNFRDLRRDEEFSKSLEEAKSALQDAQAELKKSRVKATAKLFSARAATAILAGGCIIAVFSFLGHFRASKVSNVKLVEMDQELEDNIAHIGDLKDRVEDTKGELKESREVADATFYQMTQTSVVSQGKVSLIKELEKSREYYVGILDVEDNVSLDASERARALHSLAHIEMEMERPDEALDHFEKAVAMFQEWEGKDVKLEVNDRKDVFRRLADCYLNLSLLEEHPESAEALHRRYKAQSYLKEVLEYDPTDIATSIRLAENGFRIGRALQQQNRYELAIAAYVEAAEMNLKLGADSEGEGGYELDNRLADIQFFTAESLRLLARKRESVDAYIATIETIEKLRRIDGYTQAHTILMARSFLSLGVLFSGFDDIEADDKDQVYNEALRLVVPLNRAAPDDLGIAILLSNILARLAQVELEVGNRDEGYRLSVRGIDSLIEALNVHPEHLNGSMRLAEARLRHMKFIGNDKETKKNAARRGYETAEKAYALFVPIANDLLPSERSNLDQRLRAVFLSFSKVCSDLGLVDVAAKCSEIATVKL